MKTFPLDFIRQVLEQTLEEEHNKYPQKYFGGKNQVNLFSFYEQLQKEEEVNRYVEIYRDLTDQQNRTGLIMNGTIIAPENPTITNINQGLIIPMSFTCSFRIKLGDRDTAIETINNLFDILKGRKRDIAMFDNGSLFMVGTIANQVNGTPTLANGDYLGEFDGQQLTVDGWMTTRLPQLTALGITIPSTTQLHNMYFYAQDTGDDKMYAIKWNATDSKWDIYSGEDIPQPPEHNSFEKYKLSISFDSIRCDEPRTLNSNEYCVISFGGSATLVSDGIVLGNDLTKVGIAKTKIIANPTITINGSANWLEPLELPSGNNPETKVNQLIANKFVNNSHSNGITLAVEYSFIVNKKITFLKQLFNYARYGTQGTVSNSYSDGVSPNMIYTVNEIWSSWGEIENISFYAKVGESIDIESTESDVLTISLPLPIQGENN